MGPWHSFGTRTRIWSTTLDHGVEVQAPEGCTAVVARDERSSANTLYVYVAAEASSDLAVPFADRPLEGPLEISLPAGEYLTYWFAPGTGRYFGWETRHVAAGEQNTGRLQLDLPGTASDVVALIKRTA